MAKVVQPDDRPFSSEAREGESLAKGLNEH